GSFNVSLPETDLHNEQAGKSNEKLAENPCVTLPDVPIPAPLLGELADSRRTHENGEQSSQSGSLTEESSGGNVPEQTVQPEEGDVPASLDSRELFEGALAITNPQEPKAPAIQPASGTDRKMATSSEPEKEGVAPSRLTYR